MFEKPKRENTKLRIAIQGLSYTGKTYTALTIGEGLVGEEGKIALVDCEGGEAEMYADKFNFDIFTMEPPYTPEKFIECIKMAKEEGYDAVILDTISVEWSGEGGLLEDHNRLEKEMKSKMASFNAWGDITPRHNRFINAMVQAGIHVIATIRSKQMHVIDVVDGRNVPKRVGLGPVQRDMLDYEFSIYLEMDDCHLATVRKDRTQVMGDFGTVFLPDANTGKALRDWLNGENPRVDVVTVPAKKEKIKTFEQVEVDKIRKTYQENGWSEAALDAAKLGDGKYDADRINADFKQRTSLTKKAAEKKKELAKKDGVESVRGEYRCEVCGAEISKGQSETSRLFTGKSLCPKCKSEV